MCFEWNFIFQNMQNYNHLFSRPQETPETILEKLEKQEEELKLKETSTNLIQAIKDKKAEKHRVKQEKIDARAKRESDRKKARREEYEAKRNARKKEFASNKKENDEMSEDRSEEYEKKKEQRPPKEEKYQKYGSCATVWKFDKFTATQILREINFEESSSSKSAFLQFQRL